MIWIWILITILTDLFRDHEALRLGKAGWVFFLVFVPFLTALIYFGVRGRGCASARSRRSRRRRRRWTGTSAIPRRPRPPTSSRSSADLHDKGTISDEEFAQMKAKLVG